MILRGFGAAEGEVQQQDSGTSATSRLWDWLKSMQGIGFVFTTLEAMYSTVASKFSGTGGGIGASSFDSFDAFWLAYSSGPSTFRKTINVGAIASIPGFENFSPDGTMTREQLQLAYESSVKASKMLYGSASSILGMAFVFTVGMMYMTRKRGK